MEYVSDGDYRYLLDRESVGNVASDDVCIEIHPLSRHRRHFKLVAAGSRHRRLYVLDASGTSRPVERIVRVRTHDEAEVLSVTFLRDVLERIASPNVVPYWVMVEQEVYLEPDVR